MMALFILLLGFVLYTYAGYPLLCFLLARLWPRPLQARDAATTVTVVIAAYRERATIAAKLASLARQSYLDGPPGRLDVIVVCDGSDDGTAEVARAAGAQQARCPVARSWRTRPGKPAAWIRLPTNRSDCS